MKAKEQIADKKGESLEQQVLNLRTEEEAQKCLDLNYMVFTYGKYHNDAINQLIHVIFVPIIVFTWYV